MSLLGSIFGNGSKDQQNDDDARKTLFDESVNLPERPQHKPVKRKTKAAEQAPDADEAAAAGGGDVSRAQEEGSSSSPSKEKKKRKPRKKDKRNDGAAADSGENGNNADGNATTTDSKKTDQDNAEEDEENESTIFVGNLPLANTTRKSLAKLFADCGSIKSTRLRNIPVTGIKLPPSQAGNQDLMRKVCVNTGNIDLESSQITIQGYVVFEDVESVEKALKKNNVIKVNGFTLRVDRASPTKDASRSVFCGNLPYGASETTLQQHFQRGCSLGKGDIERVRLIRDKETRQCKGFGYVLFREKSMVPMALKLHKTTYEKRELRVLVCGKRLKSQSNGNGKAKRDRKSVGAAKEQITAGAFRRILAKQANDATKGRAKNNNNDKQRKRGVKRKSDGPNSNSGGSGGLSKRAASDKKADKRVKKLQKRITKGMGKNKIR